MKAGKLGVVTGEFDTIENLDRVIDQGGENLHQCLEIQRKVSTSEGVMLYEGRAAIETVEEREQIDISDGEITQAQRPTKITKYTHFIACPGEFVVAKDSSGVFVFDLIASQHSGVTVIEAEIDLEGYLLEQQNADPWKAGFYGKSGKAENGVVHGDNLFDDSDFGEVIGNCQLNQIGLDIKNSQKKIKMTAAESGYLEIYQPSDFSSEEFSEYILDHIIHHID